MGNKTLENLLELVNTKMGLQSFSHGVEYVVTVGHNSKNDRLTRLENAMEKLPTDCATQNNRQFCSNCQKPGHRYR